jgi:hypothetical protein
VQVAIEVMIEMLVMSLKRPLKQVCALRFVHNEHNHVQAPLHVTLQCCLKANVLCLALVAGTYEDDEEEDTTVDRMTQNIEGEEEDGDEKVHKQ